MPKRFAAYGWQVIPAVDGHDVEAVDSAIRKAKRRRNRLAGRPTLICCKTVIAKGAPNKANTGAAHGAPLGDEEIAATRAGDRLAAPAVRDPGRRPRRAGTPAKPASGPSASGTSCSRRTPAQHPAEAAEFHAASPASCRRTSPEAAKAWSRRPNQKAETIATRKASQNVLEALVPALPELVGGSADLTGSNLTMVKARRRVRHRGRPATTSSTASASSACAR